MTAQQAVEKVNPRALVIFLVLTVAGGFGNCSQSAVNAIMNELAVDLNVTLATGQWLSTGYILALGVAVPLSSYWYKRFSERFVVLLALGLFAAGSLMMVFASGFALALIGRVLQASGTGLVLPLLPTMVMLDMPRARTGLYMSIFGVAMGFMNNVGPTLSGALSSAFGWRSFFWLGFGVSALLMVPALLAGRTRSEEAPAEDFDLVSFVLCGGGFVGVLLGFSNASSVGFGAAITLVPIAVGAVLMVLFVRRQLAASSPLINMAIFKNRQYVAGFWAINFLYLSFLGVLLITPLFVTDVQGGTTLEGGMVLAPAAALSLIGNLACGMLSDKIGSRRVMMFTGFCLTLGGVGALFFNENTSFAFMATVQAIRTLGVAGSIVVLSSWSLADLPRDIVSDGSAFSLIGRQAAGSFGTSLMVFSITALSATGNVLLSFQVAFAIAAVFAVAMWAIIARRS